MSEIAVIWTMQGTTRDVPIASRCETLVPRRQSQASRRRRSVSQNIPHQDLSLHPGLGTVAVFESSRRTASKIVGSWPLRACSLLEIEMSPCDCVFGEEVNQLCSVQPTFFPSPPQQIPTASSMARWSSLAAGKITKGTRFGTP